MKKRLAVFAGFLAMVTVALPCAWAQAPEGPMVPQPGVPIQKE
jgi:hypothetical protein